MDANGQRHADQDAVIQLLITLLLEARVTRYLVAQLLAQHADSPDHLTALMQDAFDKADQDIEDLVNQLGL